MSESQSLNINLDGKSIEILKKVDPIFRDSIINIGLRMVENTEFFNTVVEGNKKNIEEIVSLESLSNDSNLNEKHIKEEKNTVKVEKPKTSWDSF